MEVFFGNCFRTLSVNNMGLFFLSALINFQLENFVISFPDRSRLNLGDERDELIRVDDDGLIQAIS